MKTKRKRARCCCCSWSSSSSSLESWSCCSSSWCCPCCNSSVNEEDAGKGGTRNNVINEIFVLVLRDGVVALVGSRNGAMVLLVFSSLFVAFTSRLFLFRFFCERLVVFFFWWMMDLRKGETLSYTLALTHTRQPTHVDILLMAVFDFCPNFSTQPTGSLDYVHHLEEWSIFVGEKGEWLGSIPIWLLNIRLHKETTIHYCTP